MTTPPRFTAVSSTKRTGATATPALLAQALAEAMVAAWAGPAGDRVTILEPAVGDGVLVEALLAALAESGKARGCVLEVHAHDISAPALAQTRARLALRTGGQLRLHLHPGDFLAAPDPPPVDLVIANPPWVRTQVLGADRAQALARAHGLRGRLDLAHAFVVRSTALLAPGGIAGLWLSNKLLSTRGTAGLRALLRPRLRALWDLGDTRLFDAAVLPAALLLGAPLPPGTAAPPVPMLRVHCRPPEAPPLPGPVPALSPRHSPPGPAALPDGRLVTVERGQLAPGEDGDHWRLETPESRAFLAAVDAATGARFAALGPVKVGIKSTADAVFVRCDWEAVAQPLPELLRPLTTHRSARPLCPRHPDPAWRVLYPHRVDNGVRTAVPLDEIPAAAAWLARHRPRLEGRRYLAAAGRQWHELWVAHDPEGWAGPKLVCRDIAARPTMWVDLEGTVVNGDCYWIPVDSADDPRLWAAAAVGCSTLALQWYDLRFGNRLYAGRRRFLTQYLRHFPLPAAPGALAGLAAQARALYDQLAAAPVVPDEPRSDPRWAAAFSALDAAVWRAFGLSAPPPDPPASPGAEPPCPVP